MKNYMLTLFKYMAWAFLLFAIAVFVADRQARAASCTPGTDCYCDKVQGGSLNDTALLFCEDFEAPTLRLNQGVGNGAPYYGPWYDNTGDSNDRGHNSYWTQKYVGSVSGFQWATNQPSSPTYGSACTFYANCNGHKVWDSEDRWDGNAYTPYMAIYDEASDFTAENGALTVPTNTANGGAAGVFDGNASLTYRIPSGSNMLGGIAGIAPFGSTVFEIGLTMAIAYPTNSLSSGIWGTTGVPAAWKHNEWNTVNAPNCGYDGLFVFYNQEGPRSGRPFAGFIGAFGSDCTGGNYSGSITDQTAGSATATADFITWNSPENYDQATDWPEGTWGCVRGHLLVSGGIVRHRVWFQGPNDSEERLLIDISATTTGLDLVGGYNGMSWNDYANTNQGGGYTPSTALTFRYEDNLHVREGIPVSCAQIGFGEQQAQTSPSGSRWIVFALLLLAGLPLAAAIVMAPRKRPASATVSPVSA